MRRKFRKIAAIAICCTMLLGQSSICHAADNPEPEREPFLEQLHSSIPDNSTPERYSLPGEDWNAYNLAGALGNPFRVDLLFGTVVDEITIVDDEPDLYLAKLQEKEAILNGEIELTDKLNELILVAADGGYFPHTKNNGQVFTGTMQILPYNGVIHHIVIAEQYEVRPGDTLGQIILDCGWLPEGRSLYGPNGYLEQYAEQQHFDLNQTLLPGDIVRWRSEDIQVVDNLYPDIKIGIIPGNFFSAGTATVFDDEVADVINSIPILSDLIEVTSP